MNNRWKLDKFQDWGDRLVLVLNDVKRELNPVKVTYRHGRRKYEWAGWGVQIDPAYQNEIDVVMLEFLVRYMETKGVV
jgi:hypothetical protein